MFRILTALALLGGVLCSTAERPMAARALTIHDREFLRYGITISGERVYDMQMVARVSTDGTELELFIGKHLIGSKYPLPAQYTNWQRQCRVSLARGTLLESFGDYRAEVRLDERTGEQYHHLVMDYQRLLATYTTELWDGYEARTMTARVRLVAGYSDWDLTSIGFVGTRFLDLTSGGVVYGIYPSVCKEAIPVQAHYLGREVVTTPAGTFTTRVFGIGVPDPFLAQLLDSYVRELKVWMEDSPRGLVIKTCTPVENHLLEGIGEWRESP